MMRVEDTSRYRHMLRVMRLYVMTRGVLETDWVGKELLRDVYAAADLAAVIVALEELLA
jgi:hypothetical protein